MRLGEEGLRILIMKLGNKRRRFDKAFIPFERD